MDTYIMPKFRLSLVFVLLVGLLIIVSCERVEERLPDKEVAGRETEDPFNKIYTAEMEEGLVTDFSVTEIPADAFTEVRDDPVDIPEYMPEKIHPLLLEWLGTRPANEVEKLVINFRDDLTVPRFPEPAIEEPRDSPMNTRLLARAGELIQEITEKRSQDHDRLSRELSEQYRARIIERFWLVNALHVEMPLGMVRELAERDDVLYIEPEQTMDEPPQNTVAAGRARIVSDPYFNLGLTRGWIGLLDTGVRRTHVQFNAPSNLDFWRDCVNGTGGNCTTPAANQDPDDDCWNHGTRTAAIISGNAALGNAYRGVTGITLDSFKVYPSGCVGLNTAATLRGFQAAIAVLDRVIVAEMQGSGNHNSSISVAANNAFDAGAVIIAANGNNGPADSTVNVPANAHRVIGVGSFHVVNLNQMNSQSRGPTGDGRIKPDVQAPTLTETASSTSDSAVAVYGGTSGATPYASGAAALLRNWLRGTSFSIDPGQVYAHLILSGQDAFPFDNTTGAGPIQMPTNGWAWWGKVSLTPWRQVNIPLHVRRPGDIFEGALWWPESSGQVHNTIFLLLIDPNNNVRAASTSIQSVFQRARADGPIEQGTWTLRIWRIPTGMTIFTHPQTVYWAGRYR